MRNPFAGVVQSIVKRFVSPKPQVKTPTSIPTPQPKKPSIFDTIKSAFDRATKRTQVTKPKSTEQQILDAISSQDKELKQKLEDYQRNTQATRETGSLTSLDKKIYQKEFEDDVKKAILDNSEEIRRKYYQYAKRESTDEPQKYSELILQNVYALIEQYIDGEREQFAYGAKLLKTALDAQIQNYGRYKVAMALENAPHEAIASAQIVIFASTQEQKQSGLTRFLQIITGEVLSMEEAMAIGEALDAEDSADYGI